MLDVRLYDWLVQSHMHALCHSKSEISHLYFGSINKCVHGQMSMSDMLSLGICPLHEAADIATFTYT